MQDAALAGSGSGLPPYCKATAEWLLRIYGDSVKPSIDELRQIKVPTLVLCGENTTLPDRRVTEIVRDQIPRSTYKEIPGADHMSPLSHPSFIAEATREHARLS